VIDLVGYTQVCGYAPGDSKRLLEAISILTGKSNEPTIPKPPKVEKTGLTSYRWHDFYTMSDQVLTYAKARGISEEVLKAHKIGSRQYMGRTWMTIPTFHDGRLIGIKMRNIGQGLRYRGVGGSKRGLFNYDGVLYSTGRVFVVKGEIAAMVLLSHGLLARAPTGGEGMRLTQPIIRALALADVVVIGDNDPDPHVRKETRKLAVRRAKDLNGKLSFPPETYKDVNEWIIEEPGTIDILLENLLY
jgi:hypothetical protein